MSRSLQLAALLFLFATPFLIGCGGSGGENTVRPQVTPDEDLESYGDEIATKPSGDST